MTIGRGLVRCVRALLVTGCAALGGCGGGGEDGGPPPGAAGIWRDGTTIALVAPHGEVRIVRMAVPGGDALDHMVCNVGSAGDFQSTCAAFVQRGATGGLPHTLSAKGHLDPVGRLQLELGLTPPWRLDLPHSVTESQAAIAAPTLVGAWHYADGNGYAVGLFIDAGSNVMGTDSVGCVFTGTVEPLVGGINVYEWSLRIEACQINRTLVRGLGAYIDGRFLAALSWGFSGPYVWQLAKQ